MFAAVLGAILAAGVAGLNLGVAQFEQGRVYAVARQIAGRDAVLWGRRIYKWQHCVPEAPATQCPSVSPAVGEFQFACMGAPGASQIAPTFNPPVWPLVAGADPDEITVTVTITCPSLLGGNATQSATVHLSLSQYVN